LPAKPSNVEYISDADTERRIQDAATMLLDACLAANSASADAPGAHDAEWRRCQAISVAVQALVMAEDLRPGAALQDRHGRVRADWLMTSLLGLGAGAGSVISAIGARGRGHAATAFARLRGRPAVSHSGGAAVTAALFHFPRPAGPPLRPSDAARFVAAPEADFAERLFCRLTDRRAADRLVCTPGVRQADRLPNPRPMVILHIDGDERMITADAARRLAVLVQAPPLSREGAAHDLIGAADLAETIASQLARWR
jgi:hypothetical protein